MLTIGVDIVEIARIEQVAQRWGDRFLEHVYTPAELAYCRGDVARLADIEPHVLRYWESEFDELKPRKSNTGRRLFTKKDIDTVMEIRSLLYDEGFSIAGAKKRMQKRKKTDNNRDAIIEAVRQTKKGLDEILTILNRQ